MEEILGHRFTPEELGPAERLSALSQPVLSAARCLFARSTILAVMYLQELAPGTQVNDAMSFLERVIEGGANVEEWERSRMRRATTLLNRVGFFSELRHGNQQGPRLKDAIRPAEDPDEARISRYLKAGKVLMASPGIVRDVLDPEGAIIGSLSILTDGRYAWPSDLAYYVEHYHVRLADEFVRHMAAQEWRVPDQIDMSTLQLT